MQCEQCGVRLPIERQHVPQLCEPNGVSMDADCICPCADCLVDRCEYPGVCPAVWPDHTHVARCTKCDWIFTGKYEETMEAANLHSTNEDHEVHSEPLNQPA